MAERKYPEWMGKMRGLTPEEIMTFLAGPIVARVATIDEDGLPYITPVWQEWDGTAMWIVPARALSLGKPYPTRTSCRDFLCPGQQSLYRVLMHGVAEIVSGPEPMQGTMLGGSQPHGGALFGRAWARISCSYL